MRADSQCLCRKVSSAQLAGKPIRRAGSAVPTVGMTSCETNRIRKRASSCSGRCRSSSSALGSAEETTAASSRRAVDNVRRSRNSNRRQGADQIAAAIARESNEMDAKRAIRVSNRAQHRPRAPQRKERSPLRPPAPPANAKDGRDAGAAVVGATARKARRSSMPRRKCVRTVMRRRKIAASPSEGKRVATANAVTVLRCRLRPSWRNRPVACRARPRPARSSAGVAGSDAVGDPAAVARVARSRRNDRNRDSGVKRAEQIGGWSAESSSGSRRSARSCRPA